MGSPAYRPVGEVDKSNAERIIQDFVRERQQGTGDRMLTARMRINAEVTTYEMPQGSKVVDLPK
jgi:hypothetical protein